jgi:hypothetical protein
MLARPALTVTRAQTGACPCPSGLRSSCRRHGAIGVAPAGRRQAGLAVVDRHLGDLRRLADPLPDTHVAWSARVNASLVSGHWLGRVFANVPQASRCARATGWTLTLAVAAPGLDAGRAVATGGVVVRNRGRRPAAPLRPAVRAVTSSSSSPPTASRWWCAPRPGTNGTRRASSSASVCRVFVCRRPTPRMTSCGIRHQSRAGCWRQPRRRVTAGRGRQQDPTCTRRATGFRSASRPPREEAQRPCATQETGLATELRLP